MSMIPAMTWKSTALVSGVGVLATWLASVPPVAVGGGSAVPARAVAGTTGAASDIREQAERLQAKMRQEIEYRAPSRNLFRYSATSVPRLPASLDRPPSAEQPAPIELAPAPAPMRITLSGIATDVVDGREQRTAILSTPAGVVLAREGETVGTAADGTFRVGTIGENAVALIRQDDGVSMTLRTR